MKKLLIILMACILLITGTVPLSAYTPAQQRSADALNRLGLFLGAGEDVGYMLDEELTRAQGLTLLIRVLGLEQEALKGGYVTPFTDVPEWAQPYVGCAYMLGITKGVSEDRFLPDAPLSDAMFLTMILRVLGYRDSGDFSDFVWNNPYEKAVESGLIPVSEAYTEFTRAETVEICWNALNAMIVGSEMTLVQYLIQQDVFTAEAFEEAKIIREYGELPQKTVPSAEEKKPTIVTPIFPSWILDKDDFEDDSKDETEDESEDTEKGGLIDEGDINLN